MKRTLRHTEKNPSTLNIFLAICIAAVVFFLMLSEKDGEKDIKTPSPTPTAVATITPTVTPSAAPTPQVYEALSGLLEDGTYELSISSSVGTMTYFNQHDSRWAGLPYGSEDDLIDHYGCGPTVLAMLVASFTGQETDPSAMANWAAANGYWAPQQGSHHALIPEGAAAFGFDVEPFTDYTVDAVLRALEEGHLLVALMGPGHFTQNGHFIIITNYWSGTSVSIADPNSLENTETPWETQLILDELKYSCSANGPLWLVTPK